MDSTPGVSLVVFWRIKPRVETCWARFPRAAYLAQRNARIHEHALKSQRKGSVKANPARSSTPALPGPEQLETEASVMASYYFHSVHKLRADLQYVTLGPLRPFLQSQLLKRVFRRQHELWR